MMVQHSGYGDLGEDFGERAHQIEAKLDKRFSAVRDFGWKENVKSKIEVKRALPMVQMKQEIGKTGLLKTDPRVVLANNERDENKRKRKASRISILEKEMPLEGNTLPSLVKRRKTKLAEGGGAQQEN